MSEEAGRGLQADAQHAYGHRGAVRICAAPGTERARRQTPGLRSGPRPLAPFGHPGGNLAPRAESQLGQDAADVRFDRTLADDESFGDLAVGVSLRDQVGHLPLARAEPARLLGLGPTGSGGGLARQCRQRSPDELGAQLGLGQRGCQALDQRLGLGTLGVGGLGYAARELQAGQDAVDLPQRRPLLPFAGAAPSQFERGQRLVQAPEGELRLAGQLVEPGYPLPARTAWRRV